MNFEQEIEKILPKIMNRETLFFWDKKSKELYTHDLEWACEELTALGFCHAYDDDFYLTVLSRNQFNALGLICAEIEIDDMAEFLKDLYEKFTDQKTYTSNEYNALWNEKMQVEKTLNDIKKLL